MEQAGFNHLCSMKCSAASLNKSAPPECPLNPPAGHGPPAKLHSSLLFSTSPVQCERKMCEILTFSVTNLGSKSHVCVRERSGVVRTKISLSCCRRARTREYREKSVHPARQRSAASRGLFSVINIIGNYKYSPSDYISRQQQQC
jgi:hypothetical protein